MAQIPSPRTLDRETIANHDLFWPTHGVHDLTARFWRNNGINRMPPPITEAANSLPAEVNHGRWIVKCPKDRCGGAIFASPREPVFLCPTCGSQENGGKWYSVTMPPDRIEIEAALLDRPEVFNRNRLHTESAAYLRAENATHGLRGKHGMDGS